MPPGGARHDKQGNLLTGRKSTARGKKVPCNTKIYPDQAESLEQVNKSKFICEAIDEKLARETTDR